MKIYKKASGRPSVDWTQAVVEALCWGWIDGLKKSLDAESYLQRFTPRRARSVWSKRNREHVERLLAEGRMQPVGLTHVDAAKADGRWEAAYSAQNEMVFPPAFLAAVEAHPVARRTFEGLSKSKRHLIFYGLTSAKKPETKQRRFDKFLTMLVEGKSPR